MIKRKGIKCVAVFEKDEVMGITTYKGKIVIATKHGVYIYSGNKKVSGGKMTDEFYLKTSSSIDLEYKNMAKKTVKDMKEYVSLKVKLYRKANSLTLEQFADKVGVSKMQVIRWETKRSKPSQLAMNKLKELKVM